MSTYTMSGNVMLKECTRHTRTFPLLIDLEANREADLRDLGCFTKAVIGTNECALDERP
jgi:hypothetical protein